MADEMSHNGMSPYETIKLAEMSQRGNRATGIVGIILGAIGTVGTVVSMVYAHGQSKRAQEVALAYNNGTQKQLDTLTGLLAAERDERISGDRTLSISINDTVSGQQSGQLSASQVATNEATAQILTNVMMGRYAEKPMPVSLYQDPIACKCPGGCGQ